MGSRETARADEWPRLGERAELMYCDLETMPRAGATGVWWLGLCPRALGDLLALSSIRRFFHVLGRFENIRGTIGLIGDVGGETGGVRVLNAV